MKNEIREYLVAHNASGVMEFSDSESLLEAGVIDSMTMVDLITFLENAFCVSIPEDDLVPENFDSVNAIVGYVESQQQGADVEPM